MKKVKNGLCTDKYTELYYDEDFKYNAPNDFEVIPAVLVTSENGGDGTLAKIHFQEGPIKECGVNGVCNEDLINMVIIRLQHFQNSPFNCRENACAITKLEEALMWLRKRTMDREARGVEGTHEK